MSKDRGNVVPLTLHSASQAKLLARNILESEKNDTLVTFISIEFDKEEGPVITHNTTTIERLLYAAEMLRQYALDGVSAAPPPRPGRA